MEIHRAKTMPIFNNVFSISYRVTDVSTLTPIRRMEPFLGHFDLKFGPTKEFTLAGGVKK
jgi:hypothetical protein